MSLSRCLDLSKTRDFLHSGQNLLFFTEVEKALRIFAFLPQDDLTYAASFNMAYLNDISRKFKMKSAQLLLSWVRDNICNSRFVLNKTADDKLDFNVGTAAPMLAKFQLGSLTNNKELLLSMSNAMVRTQDKMTVLEKVNSEVVDQLSAQSSLLSSPQKRKAAQGMSSVNPHLRKRKPAKGLAFVEDGSD